MTFNRISKIVIPLFIVMQLFMMLVVTPVRAFADDDDDSDATGYAGQIVKVVRDIASNDGDGYGTQKDAWAGDQWSNLAAGNAFFGILNKNSNTVTYANLYNANTTNKGEKVVRAQGDAATYGAALDDTGLDHSSASGANNYMFVLIGRALFGAIAYVGYGLDVLSYWGYSMVGKLAQQINLFAWISTPPSGDNSGFAFIHDRLYTYYKKIAGLEMVIISFMCLAGIGLAILGRKVSKQGREVATHAGMRHSLYRFLVRVGMIVLVPVAAASIFTSVVNSVATLYNSKSDASVDYAVNSNLFDFGGWVKHSRLQLPDRLNHQLTAGVDSDSGSAVAQKPITHEQILYLNRDGAGSTGAKNALAEYDSTKATSAQLKAASAQGVSGSTASADSGTSNLLFRWFRYSQYNSSDYSSFMVAHMPYSYTKSKSGHSLGSQSDFKSAISGEGYGGSSDDQFATNGNLKVDGNGKFYNSTTASYYNDIESDKTYGVLNVGGLSALGMYNYLSSIFDSTSVTWVDATSLSTIFTSPIHADVGLVGHGMVAIGNMFNMLALLFSLAIINIMFLFFTFTAIIKTLPRLGSYAFMSASLSYGVKLIQGIILFAIEIIGGAFLCQLFKEIVISISQFTDSFVSKQNTGTIATFLTGGQKNVALSGGLGANAYGFLNVIMAILMIYLTLKLIKWRGPILQSVGKIVEDAGNILLQSFEGTAAMPSNHIGEGNMPTVGKDGSNTGGLTGGNDGSNGGNGADGQPGRPGAGADGVNGVNGASGGNGTGGANGKGGSLGGRGVKGMRNARKAREAAQGHRMTGGQAMRFYAGRMARGAAYGAASKTLGALGEAGGINSLTNAANGIDNFRQGRDAKANERAHEANEALDKAKELGLDKPSGADFEALSKDRNDIGDAGNLSQMADEYDKNGGGVSESDIPDYSDDSNDHTVTGADGTQQTVDGDGNTVSYDQGGNRVVTSPSGQELYNAAKGGNQTVNPRAKMENTVAKSADSGNAEVNKTRDDLKAARFAEKQMPPSSSPAERQAAKQRTQAAENAYSKAKMKNVNRVTRKPVSKKMMKPGKTMTTRQAEKGFSNVVQTYNQIKHYSLTGQMDKAVKLNDKLQQQQQVLIDGGMKANFTKPSQAAKQLRNIRQSVTDAANGESAF